MLVPYRPSIHQSSLPFTPRDVNGYRIMVRLTSDSGWQPNTVSGSSFIEGKPNKLLEDSLSKLGSLLPGERIVLSQDAWEQVKNGLNFPFSPFNWHPSIQRSKLSPVTIQVKGNDGHVQHHDLGNYQPFILQGQALKQYPQAREFEGYSEPWMNPFRTALSQQETLKGLAWSIKELSRKKKSYGATLRKLKLNLERAEENLNAFMRGRKVAWDNVETAENRYKETKDDELLQLIRKDNFKGEKASYHRRFPIETEEALTKKIETTQSQIEQATEAYTNYEKQLEDVKTSIQKVNRAPEQINALLRNTVLRGDTVLLEYMMRHNPVWNKGASSDWNKTVVHTLIPTIRENQRWARIHKLRSRAITNPKRRVTI
jgi:hypothetical protein